MSKLLSFAIAAFAILSFTLPVNTYAQTPSTPQYKVVNATSGLNLRDRNCNRVATLSYGELLTVDTGIKSITCKINGKSLKMVAIETVFGNYNGGFVAESFISTLISGNLDLSSAKQVQVTATSGLNLRDQNCKRFTTFNNGKVIDLPTGMGGSIKICRAGNNFYSMTDVLYNGKYYLLADAYLKAV